MNDYFVGTVKSTLQTVGQFEWGKYESVDRDNLVHLR